jgi:GDP-4-dehydro-6-deoxy-D-mannose reductase
MSTGAAGEAPRNLVTGATGFAGCHLVAALLARGEAVSGLGRRAAWPGPWAHLAGRAELHACDLCDGAAVERVLRAVRPARVYHLAGFASAAGSRADPEGAWRGNLTATRALCEAVARWGGAPRIVWVGSGLVYGAQEQPCTEESPLRPDTPYAASKAAADLACYQYGRSDGLQIVRARPFNHTGPHQSPEYAVASFARQLAAVGRGEAPPVLQTGNLAARRDLSDVRDVAAAYLLLMERGRAGEAYNIGSGQTWSMQEVLDRLVALSGLSVQVRPKDELMRPGEQPVVRVDAGKLRAETGWRPAYALDRTLADVLASWREATRGQR